MAIPLGFALATLPQWWPSGFALLVRVPGLGWFRAPARYTLLCNLGLALLAGRGLDRSIPQRAFGLGLGLAFIFGAAGLGLDDRAGRTGRARKTFAWGASAGDLAVRC